MAKVHIGYRLKDPKGSFHDLVLGLSASHDEVIPIQTGRKVSGTNYQRWISRGGLIPVFVDDAAPITAKIAEARPEPPPVVPQPETSPDYEVMTKAQLLAVCKQLGLTDLVKKTRRDLIELLSAKAE